MDKEILLKELSDKIKSGEITKSDINKIIHTEKENHKFRLTTPFSITKVMYIIGILIVIMGIVLFVSQLWPSMGTFGHIFVTFGLGLLFAILGSLLINQNVEKYLGIMFHLAAFVLIPSGLAVAMSELNMEIFDIWTAAVLAAIMFIFYILLTFAHKKAFFTFFSMFFGTLLLYAIFIPLFTTKIPVNNMEDMLQYFTALIGVSYLLIGQSFQNTWNKHLTGILNFFGSIAILLSINSFVYDSGIFQILYFILLLITFYLSIILKSKSILAFSTIFLLIHISYITSEYFADSIGWPLSLIILGFTFIGFGYMSIYINKKYIKNK